MKFFFENSFWKCGFSGHFPQRNFNILFTSSFVFGLTSMSAHLWGSLYKNNDLDTGFLLCNRWQRLLRWVQNFINQIFPRHILNLCIYYLLICNFSYGTMSQLSQHTNKNTVYAAHATGVTEGRTVRQGWVTGECRRDANYRDSSHLKMHLIESASKQ